MPQSAYRRPAETAVFRYGNKNIYREGTGREDTAVNAAAFAAGLSWHEAFAALIAQSHALCKMPHDDPCIFAMLRQLGLFQQPAPKQMPAAAALCAQLDLHCQSGVTAVIMTADHRFSALLPVQTAGGMRYKARDVQDRTQSRIERVWLRWPDGQDHSPVKRRTGGGGRKGSRTPPADHAAFHYYQANPAGNLTGDCVVRAIAAVNQITWHQAMDELVIWAGRGYAAINRDEVYQNLLTGYGFVHHPPLLRGSQMLTGAQFCAEITRRYPQGEPIFAASGQNHAVAVLPFAGPDGTRRYKIVDSWDSSRRRIGGYWVRQQR